MLRSLHPDNIVVLKSNPVYRVGDVVRATGMRWNHDRNEIMSNPMFRGSILHRYLVNMRWERDYDTLVESMLQVRSNNSLLTPLSNEAVIHLRTGDVIDNHRFLSRDFVKLVQQLPNWIRRITIVTAMHFGDFHQKQLFLYTHEKEERNRECIQALFEKLKNSSTAQLNLLSTSCTDQTIAYLSTAPIFLSDFGGFSYVCKQLRVHLYNLS